MSDLKKYTPILKWKPAEQGAFLAMEEEHKDYLIPLLELVMPTVASSKKVGEKKIKKTQDEMFKEIIEKFYNKRLKEIPGEISKYWGSRPFYLDFTLLHNAEKTTELKIDSIKKIIPTGIDLGLKIIPVLNLNDDEIIKKEVFSLQKQYNYNVCLRVVISDLINKEGISQIEVLNEKIEIFLSDFNMSRKNLDLLIDIKEIDGDIGKYLEIFTISQKINKLSEWRRFIFASGAFPQSVTKCNFPEPTLLPRTDWYNWLKAIELKENKRNPIFADYTIRSPIFEESFQYFRSTTTIKYTLDDNWYIMKGKVGKFGFYLGNAKLLVEDSKRFYGEDFSWGDYNIKKKAKHYPKWAKDNSIRGTGTAKDWIAWGINHHLVLVVNQLANLS